MNLKSGLIVCREEIGQSIQTAIASQRSLTCSLGGKREVQLVGKESAPSRAVMIAALTTITARHRCTVGTMVCLPPEPCLAPRQERDDLVMLGNGLEGALHVSLAIRTAGERIYATAHPTLNALYHKGPLSELIGQYCHNCKSLRALERFITGLRITISWPCKYEKVISGLAHPHEPLGRSLYQEIAMYGAGPHSIMMQDVGRGPSRDRSKQRQVTLAKYFQDPTILLKPRFPAHVWSGTMRSFDAQLPVVNVGSRRRPTYIPVELCSVNAGQPMTTVFARHHAESTIRRQRAQLLAGPGSRKMMQRVITSLQNDAARNSVLSGFGVRLELTPATTYSRILPPPTILARGPKSLPVSNGRWSVDNARVTKHACHSSWAWVYLDSHHNDRAFISLQKTVNGLAARMQEMGVVSTSPTTGLFLLQGPDPGDSISRALGALVKRHRLALIVGILASEHLAAVRAFHQVCHITSGLCGLHVRPEDLNRPEARHCTTGLRVNLKLGGINHRIPHSDLGLFANGKTMVVGISSGMSCLGQPAPGGDITAIVASVDSNYAQWPCRIFLDSSEKDVGSTLDQMLALQVEQWAASNRQIPPEDVVVYREGVSVAAYHRQASKEVELLKRAFRRAYPPAWPGPRMSIIFADPNTRTHFLSTADADPQDCWGPVSGTVVDRSITDPQRWDFYLQVEASGEGRSPPAYYQVVWDEVFRWHCKGPSALESSVDSLQRLTNNLCFLFGASLRAKNLCSPAYHARLARVHAQMYLKDPPTDHRSGRHAWHRQQGPVLQVHPNMSQTMFYL
ncbi:RNA interference and gene silencing [Penicillium frequentans]|uniref:RNA interference and gene silencing n=1 Tax=Penicillium frequentans TaxID=3151616 RepID=A0AAD6CHM7_9EURO|nr:RNA interference and gene silencing [Penicillium glabrum]KAJ5523020.1 RNA interference and gene silencing [Penicillium glabrum]KAJ5544195.1 RNA interference and gene silencing [Penicillium glabrum]